MPSISLTQDTFDRLQLVAGTLGVSEGEAVAELLRRVAKPTPSSAQPDPGMVPIHVYYKGTRVDAEFNRKSHRIKILSGPLEGQSFDTPSRAAIEVVRAINPSINPSRNGWGFWTVNETGGLLNTIRYR
jgi:hypothetical protein